MKRYICRVNSYFILLAILVIGLSGCGKDNQTSGNESTTEAAKTTTEAATEEYSYSEFINNTPGDVSEIEKPDISTDEAEEIVDATDAVNKEIEKFEKEYRKQQEITEDNLYDYLFDLRNYLYELQLDGVESYYLNSRYLGIYFTSGIGEYVYTPEIEGIDAGAGADRMNIATYQPFYSSYPSEIDPYIDYPDDAASALVSEFPLYQFDNRGTSDDRNFDNEEVTISSVLDFGTNNVIFWHGHGEYIEGYGCVLKTTIPNSVENMVKYKNELDSGLLLLLGDAGEQYYCVTPALFEQYLPDNALANCILYLAACESGRDDSLINAMLSKGAMAVFANSGTIGTTYNLSMMKSVAEGMTRKNGDQYYTLEEALAYAQGIHGEKDWHDTRTYLTYGEGYQSVSMDWYEDYRRADRDIVMVLDRSGSMSGYPMSQTQSAALDFIDTVFEQNSRVGIVSYASEAQIDCRLTANVSLLKQKIDDLYASGATNMYEGLQYADQMLEQSSAGKKIIVLMSDGLPNEGLYNGSDYNTPLIDYASELKDKGYLIYTLGFFSDVGYESLYSVQNLMENIASPGLHYEVDSAENLVFFFDDIANQISGTQYVYIRIACPVEVTVKHDGETLSSELENENTRTSFGTLTYEYTDDTDNAYSWEDDTASDDRVKILRLKMDQDYDIQIRGTDRGTMDYTVSYPNEDGEYSDVREFPDISITSSTKAASNTAKSDTSTLKVDNDGDGTYDVTYETESGGTMKEKKNHTVLYISLGAGAFIIIILLIVIIAVVRKSKKQKTYRNDYRYQRPDPVITPKWEPTVQGAVIGLFGSFKGQSFPMTPRVVCVVGRDHTCNLKIMHKSVSRRHCTIQLLSNGYYQVTDSSTNGTYYNNQRLEPGKAYQIPRGALLVIGDPDNVLQLN